MEEQRRQLHEWIGECEESPKERARLHAAVDAMPDELLDRFQAHMFDGDDGGDVFVVDPDIGRRDAIARREEQVLARMHERFERQDANAQEQKRKPRPEGGGGDHDLFPSSAGAYISSTADLLLDWMFAFGGDDVAGIEQMQRMLTQQVEWRSDAARIERLHADMQQHLSQFIAKAKQHPEYKARVALAEQQRVHVHGDPEGITRPMPVRPFRADLGQLHFGAWFV